MLLLRRRMVPILIVVFLGTCIPVAASYFIQPVYRATITFLPVADANQAGALGSLASQFGGLSALAGLSLSSDDNKRVVGRAVLESRQFINDFIGHEELLPILFPDQWDAESRSWIDTENTPSMEDGYRLFVNDVMNIDEDRKSGLIRLGIEWTDPELAASWSNQLVEQVNQVMRDKTIDEATKSIQYLNEQLDQTQIVEIRLSIYRLIENQIQRIMLANVRDEYVFEMVDRALVPDSDKHIWPIRRLIAALSFLLSFVVGAGIYLLYDLSRQRATAPTGESRDQVS